LDAEYADYTDERGQNDKSFRVHPCDPRIPRPFCLRLAADSSCLSSSERALRWSKPIIRLNHEDPAGH
jgi:hypothetical protein